MTAKQVYKKISRVYGKEAFATLLERIRRAHNLKVLSTEESADEDGKHSHAMVLFGYSNKSKSIAKAYQDIAYKNFEEARLDVIYLLKLFDFGLEFECNGDGDGCILMSYRII